MTKRDLVVASTRHHHARLLKYYPRRQCAHSLIKSRFFRVLQIYLQYLLSYILKFLICIHAGNPKVPPRVLASVLQTMRIKTKANPTFYITCDFSQVTCNNDWSLGPYAPIALGRSGYFGVGFSNII